MRKYPLIKLDDICKKFEFVLLDSSAIINCLDSNKTEHNESSKLIYRINHKKTEEASYTFFNKYLKKTKNLFVTNLIVEELKCNAGNSIREVLSKYGWLKINKKEKTYFKEVCSTDKTRKNLVKSLQNGKIIKLNEYETNIYNSFSENKTNLWLKSENNLSEADYDFLINGAVLSKTRGKTAILSNDFPLLYSYRDLVSKERLSTERYGFFIRQKKEFFQKAYNNSQINLNS